MHKEISLPGIRGMSTGLISNRNGNRIMLGFIVRRCARELGHTPTPEEFATWANNQTQNGYSLFGRAILPGEAEVMLRHLGRVVTVRPDALIGSFKREAT